MEGLTHPDQSPISRGFTDNMSASFCLFSSGIPLSREAYMQSVDFWQRHALVQ